MVVFQSLWGNTAAIGRAIAEGLGPDTLVGGTDEITPAETEEASVLVLGAPVHAMSLPTTQTIKGVASRPRHEGDLAPDTAQPLLREWIAALPERAALFTAYDTRVPGFVGRGGVSSIERLMISHGYRLLCKSEGFYVVNRRTVHEPASMLREGELERARRWGDRLRASL